MVSLPSIDSLFHLVGTRTTSTDAVHFQCAGTRSYGTNFEVVCYDRNGHLVPISLSPYVGSECEKTGTVSFQYLKSVQGLNAPRLVSIVDPKKSIFSSFAKAIEQAALFMDIIHVGKPMYPILRSPQGTGAHLIT